MKCLSLQLPGVLGLKNFNNTNTLDRRLQQLFPSGVTFGNYKCGPMPNVIAALPNIGGAFCSTPQRLLTPTTRVPCSNATKRRNPLKITGVSQTRQRISAASGPKFTVLSGHVEEVLLFNKFFRLSMHALVAKISSDKVVRWCPDGAFLAIFWVLHVQRATCGTFQTCILNSH